MLASLYNVPVDDIGFLEFSFANVDEHRKILQKLRLSYGIRLTEYIIDPIPMFDFPTWARRHQQMHNQQNAVLGITGNDLSTIDLNRKDQLAAWINLHAQEHYQAANILRLT